MDDIRQKLGFRRYSDHPLHWKLAMRERDRMVLGLSRAAAGEAWLIVMAPTEDERDQWIEALGNVTIHSIETPADECKRRIMHDPRREGERDRLVQAVDDYFMKRAAASPCMLVGCT
jgi:hypothetical protein